jgi:tRNA-2-methylthio-N6-dimethylallyladenosine synthase
MSFPVFPKRVYIETYGCQMNVADTEVVGGILTKNGYVMTSEMEGADVLLLNTCAIRENAEQRIYGRLGLLNKMKREQSGVVIGVLGCMAERLREKLVVEEQLVDVIVGPDEYRRLPSLLEAAWDGEKGIAVRLSRVENYEDIVPLRTAGISAWLSVMRGCDKFCSFCVVPFTRGRERSRTLRSVIDEIAGLVGQGYREVTLLGQNVNSYNDSGADFADLLVAVASVDPTVRIRFTTSHPQDMSDKLIETIARHDNLCNYIHLPVQSGSERILGLMSRSYTLEHYRKLVERIRGTIPGVSLTTDLIAGFPTETLEDHRMTLDLLQEIRYDGAYTFKYSAREHTKAFEMPETVLDEEKGMRVQELTTEQHKISEELNKAMIGSIQHILVEGPSRKSPQEYTGRTDTNKTAVFPWEGESVGEYIDVRVERANSATLFTRRVDSAPAAAGERAA